MGLALNHLAGMLARSSKFDVAINALLRASTIGLRLILTLYLASFVGLSENGQYGLIIGLSVIIPTVCGLGLHYKSNRDIVTHNSDVVAGVVVARLYIIFPLTFIFTAASVAVMQRLYQFDTQECIIALLCLAIDALLTELHLILISRNKSRFANSVYLIRNGAWILPFVGVSYLNIELRNLSTLMCFWLSALVLSFMLLALKYMKAFLGRKKSVPQSALSPSWLNYFGDIANASYGYLDRFIIGATLDMSTLGMYVLFVQIATSIQTLVTTSLLQPMIPQLVKAWKSDALAWQQYIRNARLKSIFLSGSASSVIFVTIAILSITIQGLEAIFSNLHILAILLCSFALRSQSDLLNYALYSSRRDLALPIINVAGLIFIVLMYVLLIIPFGILGSAIAVLLSSISMLIVRQVVVFSPNAKGAGQP